MGASSFHVFGHLGKRLAGKQFAADATMKQAVTFWLQAPDGNFFYAGIQAFVVWWDRCLHVTRE
jgi:hypothetical protein